MSSYYDIPQAERERRGIDYDLYACLEYNPQSFAVEEVEKVLAVWEGQNDGDDWRWVLKLSDGRFCFLQGGCDYTGWDCQSWASSEFKGTPEDAAKLALGELTIGDKSPMDAGLGHMLNAMTGTYLDNVQQVYDSLMEQLTSNKLKTWRENTDSEFGL